MPDHPDEHIIEAIGRCRIIIRDGNVVSVTEPLIRECPLARRFAVPVDAITAEGVAENILHRIRSFGMCTADRQVLTSGEFVGFGASELISFGLATGVFDAGVIACDGAGTVIATTPELVQGIGGRMSGLVKTSPHPAVITAIRENGGIVPFPDTAGIDQVRGMAAARAAGFSRIAVTIADPRDSRAIREAYPGAFIIAVHTTGINRTEAATLADFSDIITACASQAVRDVAGSRALLQAGSSVPVFAMTQPAKDLILEKVRTGAGQFLVTGACLPYAGDAGPEPLV